MTSYHRDAILLHNTTIRSGLTELDWLVFSPSTGYIQDVGKGGAPISRFSSDKTLDYNGKFVFPGFIESHIHMSSVGKALNNVRLWDCPSLQEFQKRIIEFRGGHSSRRWVCGRGWEQDVMGCYPTSADIDAVCSDRPVLLLRVCGHVAVVNTKAFEAAGITKDTPDPPGGKLDRYPAGHKNAGELTGIVRESAKDIVAALTDTDHTENIKLGIKSCLENGVTSVHTLEADTWRQYCELADKDELPLRVFFSAYYSVKDSGNFPKPNESRGPMLSCDRIKLFADGSLGASTAALSIPYVGTEDKGILMYTQDKFNALVHEANSAGFRLEIHVIGDAAAEAALDAMEFARVSPDKRPILTHCQILRADLIQRMKAQGAIANIQPQFVFTDSTWVEKRLPEALMKHSYAWLTLWKEGIVCAGGSDAPVEPPEPLLGIYDAVYRPHGKRNKPPLKTFMPQECLSIDQALDLYTRNGAFTTFREKDLGQLLPGYQADFVVLDRDIRSEPEALLDTSVLETWVAGKKRWAK